MIQYFGKNRVRQLVQWIKNTFVRKTDLENAPSADSEISYILVIDGSKNIKKISIEDLSSYLLGKDTYIIQ